MRVWIVIILLVVAMAITNDVTSAVPVQVSSSQKTGQRNVEDALDADGKFQIKLRHHVAGKRSW